MASVTVRLPDGRRVSGAYVDIQKPLFWWWKKTSYVTDAEGIAHIPEPGLSFIDRKARVSVSIRKGIWSTYSWKGEWSINIFGQFVPRDLDVTLTGSDAPDGDNDLLIKGVVIAAIIVGAVITIPRILTYAAQSVNPYKKGEGGRRDI